MHYHEPDIDRLISLYLSRRASESERQELEKWYGVKVEVKGKPPADWHIRARYQHEDLRHVLRDICFNKNIEFELRDKNVLITF